MANPENRNSADVARRKKQDQQLAEVIPPLESLLAILAPQRKMLDVLQSVSAGLYEELDKLAKKSPADQITTLALNQVNDLIRESKALVSGDPFMQRYSEFVPAGDNPEHRDVVVMLRQIRQALDRFSEAIDMQQKAAAVLLADAKGIRVAISLYLQGERIIRVDDFRRNSVSVSSRFMNEYSFNFHTLDQTNIAAHFALPQ